MEERILLFLNETYQVEFYKIEAVTNEMYRCHSRKGIFYVRITNYKTYEEQLEELKWTHYLFHQGVGVAEIVPSSKGSFLEPLSLDEEQLCVVFKAAPGIHLPRTEWNEAVFRVLGQQIGRMHRVSKGYMNAEATVTIRHWYESKEYDFLKYIPVEEKSIREIADGVVAQIKELPQDQTNYGLIHGDLWLENILVDRDSALSMIDFQDCEQHFYIYDLVVPIYSALEYSFMGGGNLRDYERSITKALLEGYQEEHPLSSEMLTKFPLFLKLKECFEYNLMHKYWNFEELSEAEVRILNLYRNKIETRWGTGALDEQ